MDHELRFICSLLHARKDQQDQFYLRRPPFKVFALREKEMRWLVQQYEAHGQFPTSRLFAARFNVVTRKVKDVPAAALQMVLDEYSYRQIRALTERTGSMVQDNVDMRQVLAHFRRDAQKLDTFFADYDDIDWGNSGGALARYRNLSKQRRMGAHAVFDSPWPTMNRIIRYVKPGEFVCIYGRMAMGKSYVAIEWAHHLAVNLGVPVLFVSKEMPTEQVEDRFEVRHLGLNPDDFRDQTLPPMEMVRWLRFRRKPHKLPLVITGKETLAGVGLDDIAAKVQQYRPQAVFIDGAYLINPEGSLRMSRNERYEEVSRTCKRLAKATQTAVFGVIQQNRDAEKAKSSKGGLATIYGSDAWAQDSDFTFEVTGKRESSTREIVVTKARDSGVGSFIINYSFNPKLDFSEVTGGQKSAGAASEKTVPFNFDLKQRTAK